MTQLLLRPNIELEPKDLAIGGRRLEILCVKNLEPLIAELEAEGRQGIAHFPFWVKIWEASIVLTDWLVHTELDKNQEILEIGAGMGITGLFLGAFGHRVTLTDNQADALALMEKNAAHNKIETVRISTLDWHKPNTDETWDIICGSELIYRKSDVAPVIEILRKKLKPGGTAYLAHDIARMSMMEFLMEAEKEFDLSHKGMAFTGMGEKKQIIIHTLKHKA